MVTEGSHIRITALDELHLLSKISDIIKACDSSNNMMVNIYLIRKGYFLYSNSAFKNIVGDKYKNL